MEIVFTCLSNDGKDRVLILRREDGRYSYEEQHFSEDEYEMCWITRGGRGLYDSQATALLEAQGNVTWLITEANTRPRP